MKRTPKVAPFRAEQFTATKWDTAEEKARWANTLAAWIVGGFPDSGWGPKLYDQLCNLFSHIAHFNRHEFHATWFSTPESRAEWVDHVLRQRCFGDPAYTWSDVEKAFQTWLRSHIVAAQIRADAVASTEARERAQLAALLKKYPDAGPPLATDGAQVLLFA